MQRKLTETNHLSGGGRNVERGAGERERGGGREEEGAGPRYSPQRDYVYKTCRVACCTVR
jgi:hypothetical protein